VDFRVVPTAALFLTGATIGPTTHCTGRECRRCAASLIAVFFAPVNFAVRPRWLDRTRSVRFAAVWYNILMSVKDIETAITRLPAHEVVELMSWLAEYHAQLWDQQIEEDLEAGHLDRLLAEVEQEYQAGQAQPL
jgi:hypothetical protein